MMEKIRNKIERIVKVNRVVDLRKREEKIGNERKIEREIELVKVDGKGEEREEKLSMEDELKDKVVDEKKENLILEIKGK